MWLTYMLYDSERNVWQTCFTFWTEKCDSFEMSFLRFFLKSPESLKHKYLFVVVGRNLLFQLNWNRVFVPTMLLVLHVKSCLTDCLFVCLCTTAKNSKHVGSHVSVLMHLSTMVRPFLDKSFWQLLILALCPVVDNMWVNVFECKTETH